MRSFLDTNTMRKPQSREWGTITYNIHTTVPCDSNYRVEGSEIDTCRRAMLNQLHVRLSETVMKPATSKGNCQRVRQTVAGGQALTDDTHVGRC
jgi:hypothetical protein